MTKSLPKQEADRRAHTIQKTKDVNNKIDL